MREAKLELAQKILKSDDVKAGLVLIYDGDAAVTAMEGAPTDILQLIGHALNKLAKTTNMDRETVYSSVIEAANLHAESDVYPTWDIEGD